MFNEFESVLGVKEFGEDVMFVFKSSCCGGWAACNKLGDGVGSTNTSLPSTASATGLGRSINTIPPQRGHARI